VTGTAVDSQDLRLLRERGDRAARARLVERYLPLVRSLAWRFRGSGEPLEDLIQTGIVGLVQAIDRFDPERGSSLRAFAVPTVTGEIQRHLRDRGPGPTVPRPIRELATSVRRAGVDLAAEFGRSPTIAELSEAVGVEPEGVVEALLVSSTRVTVPLPEEADDDGAGAGASAAALATTDDRYELVEDRWAARQALRVLDGRERTIVALSYLHGVPQTQIAARLGISQMHVSRLLRRALAKAAAAGAMESRVAELRA
jgi:RNA polymerase sigma-B factor